MTNSIKFIVTQSGRARDCDGYLNFKPTQSILPYDRLSALIGSLVMENELVTIQRREHETHVHGFTKTEEGFSSSDIYFKETNYEIEDEKC